MSNRKIYHVFRDAEDEYFLENELNQANALYEQWCTESSCVRLYWEIEDENGDTIEEDCIRSQGDFPW